MPLDRQPIASSTMPAAKDRYPNHNGLSRMHGCPARDATQVREVRQGCRQLCFNLLSYTRAPGYEHQSAIGRKGAERSY